MVERCGGVVARVLVLCLAGCPGSGPGGAPITQGGASPTSPIPTSPIPTTPTPTTAPAGASREAARTLQTGGDADFDGDGKLDARTKIDGDTRTTIYYGSPGKTRLTVVLRPDRVELQGDFNEDGTIDFKHSGATVAGVRTQTSTWDTDFDGAVDETETLTITGELGRGQPVTVTARHERLVYDPTTGETTPQISERSDDGIYAHGGVDHLANFPSNGNRVPLDAARGNIRVVEQSTATPNGCSEAQQQKLAAALGALDKQIACVATANTTAAAALRHAVDARNIEMACAPSPDYGAADLGPLFGAADTGTYRVNITPTTFDTPGFSETFLHELMHVSGYAHIDQKDEDGKNDRVNTCASYCSGCIKDNRPSETPGQDCARCSEPGKKEQCGIRKGKIRSSKCHRDHLAACLQGDYKVAVDCKKCLRGGTRLCDDTPVGEDGMPLCCEICPDNTAENLACTELPNWRVDTCYDKPPACR